MASRDSTFASNKKPSSSRELVLSSQELVVSTKALESNTEYSKDQVQHTDFYRRMRANCEIILGTGDHEYDLDLVKTKGPKGRMRFAGFVRHKRGAKLGLPLLFTFPQQGREAAWRELERVLDEKAAKMMNDAQEDGGQRMLEGSALTKLLRWMDEDKVSDGDSEAMVVGRKGY